MWYSSNQVNLQDLWRVNKIICTYLDDLQTESLHENSGSVLRTDAPLDHEGQSRDFCPTDLVATALGTCLLTVMGIKARKEKWSLKGLKLEVNKKMSAIGPRKIETLSIQIFTPQDSLIINWKYLKKK